MRTQKEELKSIEGVSLVLGAREKNRVVPETLALLRPEEKTPETQADSGADFRPPTPPANGRAPS